MGVSIAQPTSILLVSTLLAAGFALLGIMLFVFVWSVAHVDRLLIRVIATGRLGSSDCESDERTEAAIFPRAERLLTRPSVAGSCDAPSRAPPPLRLSQGHSDPPAAATEGPD